MSFCSQRERLVQWHPLLYVPERRRLLLFYCTTDKWVNICTVICVAVSWLVLLWHLAPLLLTGETRIIPRRTWTCKTLLLCDGIGEWGVLPRGHSCTCDSIDLRKVSLQLSSSAVSCGVTQRFWMSLFDSSTWDRLFLLWVTFLSPPLEEMLPKLNIYPSFLWAEKITCALIDHSLWALQYPPELSVRQQSLTSAPNQTQRAGEPY